MATPQYRAFAAMCACTLFVVYMPQVWGTNIALEMARSAVETVKFAGKAYAIPGNMVKLMNRFTDKSTEPQRNFTMEQMSQYTGEGGTPLYIVVGKHVYDITDFADLHPGGKAPLKEHVGQDATLAMKASGMPDYVMDVFLNKFKVGDVLSAADADGYLARSLVHNINIMSEAGRFTRAAVAACNGKGGAPLYIIVRDVVYDITSYVNEHPGGVDPIVDNAGKDSTRDFDDAGHSSDAKTILTKYRIGELVEEEKHYDANGKKKKRVIKAAPEQQSRGCLGIISCGLVG